MSDGRGGFIVVWQDTRNGNSDIYAQHVASDSTKLWAANGTPVCAEAHEQTLPVIAADNLGGAFIVWQDYRNGNADLYIQHINSGGTVLWAADGVPVVTAANDQILPSLISDGNSGAIVVWQDLRNGLDFDIYAEKIQGNGTPAWTANGVAVAVVLNQQRYPVLASDGAYGAIITWEDYRNDVPNIFGQRLNASGVPQFAVNGINLSSSAFAETQPKIIPDGLGGAIVTWSDLRDGDADIFAQRLDGTGAFQWTGGGLAVCSATGIQKNPVLATDGYNGAIVSWEDYRNGAPDIFAQRVLSNGSLLWGINGVGIGTDPYAQALPAIVDNGAHGAIITWQDGRNSVAQGTDVYAQLVNDIGTLGGYSIHGIFFNDLNLNGIKDTNEALLPGWIINLNGPAVKIDTTDASGLYSFDGLPTGIYTLQPQIKAGWTLTSIPDSVVNLSIGGDSVRNYALFQMGTLSGLAFRDKNHDGVYQVSEPGDSGRVIRLSGAATLQMTTGKNGLFSFIGLPTGTYFLSEDPLAGFLQMNSQAVDTITIDTAGQDRAGYLFGSFQLGKITGKVYNDLAGDSAIVSGGKTDSTITGWQVKLFKGSTLVHDTLTNSSGLFTFQNLDTGKYVVQENLAVGWFQTYPKPPSDTVFADGMRGYKVGIDSGGIAVINRDFGNFRAGVISGKVFEDLLSDSSSVGDHGVAGWCVKLFENDVLLDKQYTDSGGNYRFTNIIGGTYTVEESLATGYHQTFPRNDTSLAQTRYGVSAGPLAYKITIANGKNATLDFGNFRIAVIRGVVHLDIAVDSIVVGDPPIPHWIVRLSRGGFVQNVYTNELGAYSFSVDAGHYVVEESVMVSSVQTYPRVGFPNVAVYAHNKRVYTINVDTSGEINDAVDFGISTGYLGGTVFNDRNGDGVREYSDTGMANILVYLAGKKVDSTYSDKFGQYAFAGLDTGLYYISESIPAGWIKTLPHLTANYTAKLLSGSMYAPDYDFGNFQQGSIGGVVYFDRDSNAVLDQHDPGLLGWSVVLTGVKKDTVVSDSYGRFEFSGLPLGIYSVKVLPQAGWKQTSPHDSSVVTISSGVNYHQVDFGLTGLGRISGTVFNDLNRDGTKGVSEPGVGSWRLIAQTQNRIDTAVTDATGSFSFSKLAPGIYTVHSDNPGGWLLTYPSPVVVRTVTLSPSGNNPGNDFGEFALGQIGGKVFSDDNANGITDSIEHGIAGIWLSLSGVKTDSTLTGSDGSYLFSNLDTGSYTVTERNIPFVVRSVPKQGNSYSDAITASGQVKAGRNFGHFATNIISGTVFNDLLANGLQDSVDPPLTGWRIHLHRTDIVTINDSILTTSADGIFQFTGIPFGQYVLTEELPAGWFRTLPSAPDTITVSTAGQQITGKNLGNYFALFAGKVYNDLNGDGVKDPGDPGRSGSHLYLVKNGTVIDSTISDTTGSYSFRNRGLGTYIITQAAEQFWQQTVTPAPIVLTQPSGISFANLNFGDFQRFAISGFAFEDLNRNGIMDGPEAGLIQCVLVLKKNGVSFAIDTSLSDGSYSFANLGPGTYTLAQQIRTGYLKSSPLSPDSFTIAGQSGVSVTGKNFGNYLNVSRSITARLLSDLDAKLATADDRVPKPWSIGLYRGGLLLKSVTGGSLDTANLPTGTYVVQIGDSSGSLWTVLGKRRTVHRLTLADSIIQKNGATLADTIILGGNESHIVDFVATKFGQIVVRSFVDSDATTATAGDQSGLIRSLEVYQKYIAPTNLAGTKTDSTYTLGNVGSGPFVVRQNSAGNWQVIGTRVNGQYRALAFDTVAVTLNLGTVDTIDFINGAIGTIVARNITDDDGDTLTTGDQMFAKWGFALYKNSISSSTRVDTVVAESLSTTHLVGNYILRQSRGGSWKTIWVSNDGVSVVPQDTFHVTILGGDSHRIDFINASKGRLKTWTAQTDSRWENRFNWSPAVKPTPTDSVLISGDLPWRVPRIPPHTMFTTLSIGQNAGLLLPTADTLLLNGNLINNGTLFADTGTHPVVVVNGDLKGTGNFSPGNSTIIVTSSSSRLIMGGSFSTLQIGGQAISISGSRQPLGSLNRLTGNCAVGNKLIVLDDLDATGDTIALRQDAPDALQGSGTILNGTLVRAVHAGSTERYRLWDDSSYVQFSLPGGTPSQFTAAVIPDTTPTNYGATWDSLGGQLDSVNHTIAVPNLPFLSSGLPFAFGSKIGGEWTPLLRRLYMIEAVPESGYAATIKLRYFPGDLPPGVFQSVLSLLRLRQIRKDLDDSLMAGWNMLSIPVCCLDYHTAVLFPMVTGDAFSYQPSAGYLAAAQIMPGTGYWLKFPSAHIHHYSGIEHRRDSLEVQAGWNLIGTTSYPVAVNAITSTPADIIQGQVFGLRTGYRVVDSLLPGKAYWVNISQPGILALDSHAPAIGKSAVSAPPSTLNVLFVTDAAGRQQRLSFGSAPNLNAAFYRMPPPPPEGVFDVRFDNNSSVALTPSSVKQSSRIRIDMQGVLFPVTVSWQMNEVHPTSSSLRMGDGAGNAVTLGKAGSIRIEKDEELPLTLILQKGAPVPVAYALRQCYPNPFNPTTRIDFDLPEPSEVTLVVYDIVGREVATVLRNVMYEAGTQSVIVNGSQYASGVYFYRMSARTNRAAFQEVKKMMLIK